MNNEKFYLSIGHALAGCLLLEHELKVYLGDALDFIRSRLDNRITFKMRGEDFRKDSLGTLVDRFEKFTTNGELIKQLRDFTEERNFLSHKGITELLDVDDVLDFSRADDNQSRFEAITVEAERLCLAIHAEKCKIRYVVASDFEDVSER